ncbi:MAG TPA: GDSL-type esterase/lipase family protein [Polyangia bacterium]|nr:GDSL-type esterase/lipase family protein [Polyangia bacterium]
MNNPRLVCILGGIALLGACSSSGTGDGTTGSGGNGSGGSGSGGSTATGGNSGPGTGGSSTGGTTGTGGNVSGTGGKGTGGNNATGGATGTGGSGTGGNENTGGATGAGGSGTGGNGTGGTSAGGHGGSSATGGTTGTGGTAGGSGATHWVGTWTASPYYDSANQPPASLSNGVIRQITHVSIGGSQLRVQFSNLFGNGPVNIKAAHIALCKATPLVDSTIDTTTDTALAFSGTASVTIAQGQEVWSDPVTFTVAPLGNVTITTAFGSVPSEVTGHSGSRTNSYIQTGSTTVNAASMTSATSTEHWYIISGIDVMAPAADKAAVAIGDSITDGRGSDIGKNDRWTDDLSARLQGMSTTSNVAMLNQGIGATNLVGTGTAAQARYSRDVLKQSGVRYAIIFDGVNDILGGASFSSMKTVYDSLISQGHTAGLLVYGATITPFGAYSGYSAAYESVRQQVNTYIKSGAFDGVLDFDAAVTDGGNPPKLQSQYATWTSADGSGDGLHPSPAGYQKMADSVDLSLFTK